MFFGTTVTVCSLNLSFSCYTYDTNRFSFFIPAIELLPIYLKIPLTILISLQLCILKGNLEEKKNLKEEKLWFFIVHDTYGK